MAPETTSITIPPWAKGLGMYLLGLVPVVFGFWLAMHDLQRDFGKEQEKIIEVETRLAALEDKDHADDLIRVQVSTDLTYIRESVDKLSRTVERLAE